MHTYKLLQQVACLCTLPEQTITLERRIAGPGLMINIIHKPDSA